MVKELEQAQEEGQEDKVEALLERIAANNEKTANAMEEAKTKFN